mgnify:CR=1 FL=1
MSSYEYLKPEEYKKNYINNNGIIDKEKITSAYNFAVETRKLEIELFWQRSNLFWGFVAASFTGYFALLALTDKKPELITLITILGWFVSIVWYLVCRGSKYWQENWEMHIDLLEDEISGPIYKIISNPKHCNILNLFTAYSVSVSKLNILLAFVISGIWSYLFIKSLFEIKIITDKLSTSRIILFSCLAMLICFLLILFLTKTNTRIDKNKSKLIIRK